MRRWDSHTTENHSAGGVFENESCVRNNIGCACLDLLLLTILGCCGRRVLSYLAAGKKGGSPNEGDRFRHLHSRAFRG